MDTNETSDPNQLELFTKSPVESIEALLVELDWLTQPAVLTLFGKKGEGTVVPMLQVREDMTIEYGPEYTPDAAAVVFWEALQVQGKSLTSRLIEAVDLLEEFMERAERSSSCYIIADAERDALRRENQELKLRLKSAGVK